MRYSFTAAAQRALAEAAAWSLGEFSDTLEGPALLLGLLAESECRAAITLAQHGIDIAAVQARWPSLVRLSNRFAAWDPAASPQTPPDGGVRVRRFSPEVQVSLATVARKMRNCGTMEDLGTEHLLLGLAISDHEASEWLRCQGIDAESLEEGIHQLHGHQPQSSALSALEPLPLEENDEARKPPAASTRYSAPGAQSPVFSTQHSIPPDTAHERLRILRVIDAAANRAREGLRVVEDYVRFVLDDRFFTGQFKALRHDLMAIVERFPPGDRLAARETLADVGTQLTTARELRREDTASVLGANFGRVQESLRSLEEFTKILDPAASAALEQLRYRSYTLQRAVDATRVGIERLDRARLYVLIDGRPTPEEFSRLVRSLVAAGVHVIQLRDKSLDDRTLMERARMLRGIASEAKVVVIINDRPDLAAMSGADGVHLGQEDMSVKDARAMVGPGAIIGVSTHTVQQARQAVLDGASYIGVGPTFPSQTKQFEQFPGIELLRAVAAEIRLPAFAIGGIRLENLALVREAGFQRVAVGAAIAAAPDPDCAARAFLDGLS